MKRWISPAGNMNANGIRSYDGQVQVDTEGGGNVLTVTNVDKIEKLYDACEDALNGRVGVAENVELPSYYRIGLKECGKDPDDVEKVIETLQALDVPRDELETTLEAVEDLGIDL